MPVIHHLNCASFCPHCERLVTGQGSWFKSAHFCSHCLLIEDNDSLILIDTGFGMQEIKNPESVVLPFRLAMRPKFDIKETAIHQIKMLGFDSRDIRNIALTHLDLDHAGGISDFKNATVHAHEREIRAALNPQSITEKSRYMRSQLQHNVRWSSAKTNQFDIDWFGFSGARLIPNIQTEILMIPLFGHTHGHMGFAINTGKKWLLHVGDLTMKSNFITHENYSNLGISFAERLLAEDNNIRIKNVERLRLLYKNHSDKIEIICSHDMDDFVKYKSKETA